MTLDNNLSEEDLKKVRQLHESKRFVLSFHGQLESRFKYYLLTKYAKQNRLYPLLGALGLLLFIIADWIVIPEIALRASLYRILGALMVLCFVAIAHRPMFFKWIQFALAFGAFIIHLIITLIAIEAADIGEYHYQFGSIITIIFLCSALRIKFAYVLPFALMMVAVQFYSTFYLMHLSFSQLTENIFIFSFVSLVIILLNATMEHEIRSNFLQELLLNAEQETLLKTQKKLRLLSISDGLTNLYNRRYFNQFLEREWLSAQRHQQSLTLIMIDIDEFKSYNDTYGHLKGDDVLVKVAHNLNKVIHRPDDLLARYGGEEFVAVLPDTKAESGLLIAESMRKSVEDLNITHIQSKSGDSITISLGVATIIPKADMVSLDLIKLADEALYSSKHSGKNRVTVNDASSSH
jgi:diguanylate cyclase (GGDEF)-like protein